MSPSSPSAPAQDRDGALATAVADAVAGHGGGLSVAVLDVASGATAAYAPGGGTYDTASVVKVDLVCALLLRAQDAGRDLTSQERTRAAAMIERSDNDATTAVWDDLGGAAALDAANERLGLTGTTGGSGPLWGLTQTTAADRLTLLRQVFAPGDDAVLSAESRSTVRQLMGSVEADQAWGVSAAGNAELKNGWLRRSTTQRWDVNSIGRVRVDGRQVLVAVLSDGSATMDAGVALVEAVARAAVPVVSGAG
ncbi:serine hydrolase [Streptomyces sp. SID5785]|uniref:serine hydrolase n=1 Tax=Streptomyces sp. SID5785 TaxID=2690309 RepID=UPI0031BA18B2